MKKTGIWAVLVLIVGVAVLSGCVQQPTSSSTPVATPSGTGREQTTSGTGLRSSNARYIGNFMATADKNKIEVRFSLMDGSKNYVSGDGTGQVRIVNSEGESVY